MNPQSQTKRIVLLLAMAAAALVFLPPTAFAASNTIAWYGGTYANWPATWYPIPSLNDPDDGLTADQLDFVGDAIDPGAYYASDPNYFYLRTRVDYGNDVVRVDSDTLDTFHHTIMILVDRIGYGTDGQPDYAFAWDTKGRFRSGESAEHGLEMMLPNVIGSSWSATKMQDLDGNYQRKLAPPDFNTSGNGYVRTIDHQPTTNFGDTTFIDFAISWNYLAAQTTLAPGQTWKLQLGSIHEDTDHVEISYDVAANHSPGETGLTWSGSSHSNPTAVVLEKISASTATPLTGYIAGGVLLGLVSLSLIIVKVRR